ncbi:CopG family transcriptional regulator [Pseudoduganella namucuonensis]|uniref:CopG family transcriptional regulator n=1 Tax=Pseudoduganella namucuonensis TaxID=1035707 RepID=UPI000B8514CB|nr:CopG family transcriptional regulator [Pseudoduganella namucuonensis]
MRNLKVKTMRTTLTIDDDVLAAAKGLALLHRKSVGEVISALARQALQPQGPSHTTRNGVPLLPTQTGNMPVTLEMVNKLRDELQG